jgi:hypothetical protein
MHKVFHALNGNRISIRRNAGLNCTIGFIVWVCITIKGQKIENIRGQNFIKGDFAFGKRVAQILKKSSRFR